jgi:TolB-like protein/tetratricopeptide (TPR) repeat protein
MGEVYQAEDLVLGTEVALKAIRREVAARDSMMERFRRETLLARRVTHPNVCRIFDLGQHSSSECGGDVTFLTMELLSGETLRQCLTRRGRFCADDALPLVTQMAAALGAAHEAGVVHRDFKTSNVMLVPASSADGPPRVVVTDFGLAWGGAGGTLESITHSGDLLGTPAYVAPEQVEGGEIAATADIYAFGVVLYEMMTGRLPFEADTALSTVLMRFRERAPSPRRFAPDLPPGWEKVILRCLERKASDRFATADHVVKALRAEAVPQRNARRWRHRVAAAATALVVAVGGGTWLARGPKTLEPAPDTLSVAVLPFVNMGSDKDQEYFSEGLAEDVLSSLTKVPRLRVVARPSSFRFKGSSEDPRVVGEKLDVSTLLEGSVRKEGSKVRIAAQLVKTEDGVVLWSETYDRELNGTFTVQDDIARAVAGSLKVKLLGGPAEASLARGKNAEAYDAYLQAQYFVNKYGEENYQKAIGYYEQSLKLDPAYAPAWAGLSRAYGLQAGAGYVPVDEGYQRARQAAERAITLDSGLAIAYTYLAWIQMSYDFDWEGADAAVKRALVLEPGSVTAMRFAAYIDVTQDRLEEALALLRRAESLDPLDPSLRSTHGFHALCGGHLEEAKAAFQKALELNPAQGGVRSGLAMIHLAEGRAEEALREAEREPRNGLHGQMMGAAYYALGRKKDSDAVLAELIASGHSTDAVQIASLLAYRGEADRAFEWLERARAQHDSGLIWVKIDPMLKSLHGDPRFAAFLRKMRLPV